MGLNYYPDMKYAPLSDLLEKSNIKTENQLMACSDSSWQYFPYNGRSTGAYIIFYQGGTIYNDIHFPGTVDQSSAQIEYNSECTAGMALENSRMLIHDFLTKI